MPRREHEERRIITYVNRLRHTALLELAINTLRMIQRRERELRPLPKADLALLAARTCIDRLRARVH